MRSTCKRPESSRLARSICVLSPVITAREFTPSRVRNIFICIPVAFCASSRITNASGSVRPRMYARSEERRVGKEGGGRGASYQTTNHDGGGGRERGPDGT